MEKMILNIPFGGIKVMGGKGGGKIISVFRSSTQALAALGMMGLQLPIIFTGNYSVLNWLTISLCVPLLDDASASDSNWLLWPAPQASGTTLSGCYGQHTAGLPLLPLLLPEQKQQGRQRRRRREWRASEKSEI